jgi:hypothetical protein
MILIYAAGVLTLITAVATAFIVLSRWTVMSTYDPDADAH